MNKKREPIDELFVQLHDQWDLELPLEGHSERFAKKLSAKPIIKQQKKWLPLSLAASLLLIAGLIGWYQTTIESATDPWQNATVQTIETHDYFASVVDKEITRLKSKQNPENEILIADALDQMKLFEQDLQNIISELQKNGDTKPLLHAMILNFQIRISFLEDILQKIETLTPNTIQNEKSS